ncbi:MAG: ferritin-like domain-containing protein [Acidimicrobiales bacterium]
MNEPTTPDFVLTRRHFFAGAAVLGAGLVATACGSDSATSRAATTGSPNTTTGNATATSAAAGNVDGKVATLAAGLEVLAVGTYKAALDAATAGKLGAVPPAVAEFVTAAMAQHQAHLDAWNGVITSAGGATVTAPNATLKPVVDAAFAKVTDVTAAAQLALLLEQTAAATYLSAQQVLTDKSAIKLAGSIQIVDAQHAAILLYVLGNYPVPDVFAKTDLAAAS